MCYICSGVHIMNDRAKIVLIQDDWVALIERHRAGLHYFVFPGGHIEAGETPEQAAIRETREELGVDVGIRRLVATGEWNGSRQYYYLVDLLGGVFGSGDGEEMTDPRPNKGSYTPLWMPLAEIIHYSVKPFSMAEFLVRCWQSGWPDQPVVIHG